MDLTTALVIAAAVGAFALVAFWQHGLERARDAEAEAKLKEKLKEAKELGADKAVAQHSHIHRDKCIGCGSCVIACHEGDVLSVVSGLARVVHASHCIGCAKCEAACPVCAIEVGLGDVSHRPDIPILSPELESSVPGLYIAGELGGIALVRNAIEQGKRAMDDIARRLKAEPRPKEPGVHDVLVVGVGPAGLSALFRAVELGLDYASVSLEDIGGTVLKYPRRKLTLVQAAQMPLVGKIKEGEYYKEDLLKMWGDAVCKHGITVQINASVQMITPVNGLLETKTSAGTFKSRFVVMALGRRGSPRKLGVPGEQAQHVLYELADAAALQGQRCVVVGGGNSAVEAALGLSAQPGNYVVLSHRQKEFSRLTSINKQRLEKAVAEGRIHLLPSSQVKMIETKKVVLHTCDPGGGAELPHVESDWVFVCAGGDPPFPLLQKIGVKFGKAPEPPEEGGKEKPAGGQPGEKP
jgi:thioredoxin reductase/Pyruvate/2-oxoacid:ferredoxin oxidoreductase delta subunit